MESAKPVIAGAVSRKTLILQSLQHHYENIDRAIT